MGRTNRKYSPAAVQPLPVTLGGATFGCIAQNTQDPACGGQVKWFCCKTPGRPPRTGSPRPVKLPARTPHNKTVLCIVDGFGYSERKEGNAVIAANMRNFNSAFAYYPSCHIRASGKEVGLDSDKDAGNSEVGHNAIGAGQIIKQGLSLLNDKYATGEIFSTEVWGKLSQTAKAAKLDIIILLSDGRVHSDIAHLFRVLEQCRREDITARIFAIADGRDVPPQSVKNYIKQTNEFIAEIGVNAKISAVGGRGQFFMDRYESQTELLPRAVSVCADGEGIPTADIFASIDEFYRANPAATDEQLPPFVLCGTGHTAKSDAAGRRLDDGGDLIQNGDAVLLLNYRGDRAIETARMFDFGAYISQKQFEKIKDCFFVGALQYDAENLLPRNFLCPPPRIKNTLTEWLSGHGIKQYTITETVKFGHLTYFFNGNRTDPFNAEFETSVEIESDKLNNQYDKAPEMKAAQIADKLIFNIRHGDYTFFKCNFPNPDMVGHTGVFPAVVTACRCIDKQIGRLIEVCKTDRVNLIITADHGNAEEMTDEKGKTKTAHTNNPVPFIICPFASAAACTDRAAPAGRRLDDGEKPSYKQEMQGEQEAREGVWSTQMTDRATKFNAAGRRLDDGAGLTNIAATVCDLIGIDRNPAWRGSIIK